MKLSQLLGLKMRSLVRAYADTRNQQQSGGGVMTPDDIKKLSEARQLIGANPGNPADSLQSESGSGMEGLSMLQRLRENKFVAAGIGLWTGIVVYYLARVRSRKLPLQLYLIQLRVGAQMVCIGCISLSCFYATFNKKSADETDSKTN